MSEKVDGAKRQNKAGTEHDKVVWSFLGVLIATTQHVRDEHKAARHNQGDLHMYLTPQNNSEIKTYLEKRVFALVIICFDAFRLVIA